MKSGKRYLRTICAFLIAIGVLVGCDSKKTVSEDVRVDTSWYESSKTTFTLTKASQLMGLAELSQKNDFKGKTIKLGADISLNKVDSTTIRQWRSGMTTPSNVWTPLGNFEIPFAGKIDGQGHAISGLYVNVSQEGTGFIGVAASSVELLNIRFVDGYIKNKSNYTGIIGFGLVKRIEDVYTNLIIETGASYTGGFIGWYQGGYTRLSKAEAENWGNSHMRINNCWFDGEIKSTSSDIGGCIGGQMLYAKVDITNFLATGRINITQQSYIAHTGGIFGHIQYSAQYNFTNCISTVNVNTNYTGSDNTVGALIGGLNGEGLTITNCYGIGEKVIGQIKDNVELELSDDSLKTLEEIAKLDISTALPKLEWELISPWRKKEGFVPVLRGMK